LSEPKQLVLFETPLAGKPVIKRRYAGAKRKNQQPGNQPKQLSLFDLDIEDELA
jgi:hypothetical protein